jgi:hypothetical protein
LNVTQITDRSDLIVKIGLALMFAVMMGIIGALALWTDLDAECSGWCGAGILVGGLLGTLLMAVLALAAFMLPSLLAEKKGWLKDFNGAARVTIDSNGLFIENFGRCPPAELVTFTGIPDSDNAIVVHTAKRGRLMLRVDESELLHSEIIPALAACMPDTESMVVVVCRGNGGASENPVILGREGGHPHG